MILNDFNSDDYIYFRLIKDFDSHKKGDILRFNINDLRRRALSDKISVYSTSFFQFTPKKRIDKYAIFPYQLYESATLKTKCLLYHISFDTHDIIILNDSMRKMLFSETELSPLLTMLGGVSTVAQANQQKLNKLMANEIIDTNNQMLKSIADNFIIPLFETNHNNLSDIITKYHIEKLIHLKKGLYLNIDLHQGDILSFSDPAVALLFCNQYYLRLLGSCCMLDEKEKQEYFCEEFSNCIYEYDGDIRYFVLNDDIKIKSKEDFLDSSMFPSDFPNLSFFEDMYFFEWNTFDYFDYDEHGYLRYIWIRDNRKVEMEILKIARRATIDEAREHYTHFKNRKKLEEEAFSYYLKHKNIYKRMKKENPALNYVEFMELNEQKITLQKNYMYQRLLTTFIDRRKSLEESKKPNQLILKKK